VSNSTTNHPWRRGRSGQFAAYLDTLPREERWHIEAAERASALRAALATSPRQAVARDYARSMLGALDEVLDSA
jgi:hypothetical protein